MMNDVFLPRPSAAVAGGMRLTTELRPRLPGRWLPLLALVLALVLPVAVLAQDREVLPGVTEAQLEADYWIDRLRDADTVLVDGISGPDDRDAVRRAVSGWVPSGTASGALVEIPTVYDGPDLADVARHWGVTSEEAVARHQEQEYVSRFCGFAPGFAYLGGLPADLAVPRLDSPRARVEAGSVALADRWCGIYPTASPGGWLVIGRTDAVLWDVGRASPALLAPGTRVRFEVAP